MLSRAPRPLAYQGRGCAAECGVILRRIESLTASRAARASQRVPHASISVIAFTAASASSGATPTRSRARRNRRIRDSGMPTARQPASCPRRRCRFLLRAVPDTKATHLPCSRRVIPLRHRRSSSAASLPAGLEGVVPPARAGRCQPIMCPSYLPLLLLILLLLHIVTSLTERRSTERTHRSTLSKFVWNSHSRLL